MKRKVCISFKMTEKMLERLDKHAKKYDRSRSYVINQAIEERLINRKEPHAVSNLPEGYEIDGR